MPRRDLAYWARLRVDARSSWAGGLALVAVLAAALALIGLLVDGGQAQSRSNPLYWIVLAPVIWWGSGLMGFEARYVRAMGPLLVVAPSVAGVCLAIAVSQGREWMPWLIAAVIAGATALVSRLCYRDSLLRREGPAR